MRIVERAYVESDRRALLDAGLHPVLARVYAGRRIRTAAELSYGLDGLISPQALKGVDAAARLLADAIAQQKRLLIVADYDADGATACAVGVRALRAFGAKVDYLVPDRFKLGYGLTPELVDAAPHRAQARPAHHRRQRHRQRRGRGARERARHRHADHRPPPARPGAAGRGVHRQSEPAGLRRSRRRRSPACGVMFYVMLALRAELRIEEAFRE